ncbi:MAG: glycosyltransferase family 2 protein [Caulobacteraceae bacterium]
MKSISITTPCFNEEENVEALYEAVRAVMAGIGRYRYEHIFIDNASTDRTVEIVKRLAAKDRNVKLLVNTRNFGQVGSPMYAVSQTRGDAVIGIVADFQDPPELIPEMIAAWETGVPMVLCIKRSSAENPVMYFLRKRYYRLINQLSSMETFENFTGFGLFDRKVIDQVLALGDAEPYFRGMIAELGYPHHKLFYDQPVRRRGKSKNNFFTLFDLAIVGIINHSRAPLRVMTFAGFCGALLSFLIGMAFLIYKLVFWSRFQVGVAPLVIGMFFGFSVQMILMGMLGEYVGAILTQLKHRPYAVEKERMNFEFEPDLPKAKVVETQDRVAVLN